MAICDTYYHIIIASTTWHYDIGAWDLTFYRLLNVCSCCSFHCFSNYSFQTMKSATQPKEGKKRRIRKELLVTQRKPGRGFEIKHVKII
jgi:hypothetical protein